MNWNAVQAIVRKDLKVVIRNKAVSIPLIVLPVIILVGLPAAAGLMSKGGGMGDIQSMMGPLQALLVGYDEAQGLVVYLLAFMAVPFYLLMSLTVSIAGACDSFAGEKERKTLEALLYTPTTDGELLLGKLLSAWLPALGIAWGGFLFYTVTTNLAAWPAMGRLWFPTTMWVILAVWVAPAVAGLGVVAIVLISSRAQTFQGAYQLGGLVILPILLLFILPLSGVMAFSAWLLALLGLLIWAVDAALLWFGRRGFQRTRLATEM
jgi:ABC-2 type transport system permease protein